MEGPSSSCTVYCLRCLFVKLPAAGVVTLAAAVVVVAVVVVANALGIKTKRQKRKKDIYE